MEPDWPVAITFAFAAVGVWTVGRWLYRGIDWLEDWFFGDARPKDDS